MFSKKLAALAALSLMAAGTTAQAQSAQSLSVASSPTVARAGATVEDGSEMGGGATTWIIAAVVLGLAIWGIIELTEDSSSP
jgi:hypothetical protein